MSTFFQEPITCPHCQNTCMRMVAHSVNGQRATHLRAQILDRTFQCVSCEGCGQPFMVNHPFVYIDLSRRQWFYVYSDEQEPAWQEHEAWTSRIFKFAAGPQAPAAARAVIGKVTVRTLFGIDSLREKLLCEEGGLDDVSLELLKLRLCIDAPGITQPVQHLRLTRQSEDALTFWALYLDSDGQHAVELSVPRPFYALAVKDADAELRQRIAAGSYVDIGRLFAPATV